MPTVSTRPPNRHGAILSTCAEPLATISPSMANLSSCKRGTGSSMQRIGGDHGRDGGGRRAAHAGGERNALLDLDLEAESRARAPHASPAPHGRRYCSCGSTGKFAGDAADRADPHHRLIDPSQPHPIADRLHRVPEDIEADTHVGDGGGSEGGDVVLHEDSCGRPKDARRDTRTGATDRRTRRRP